MNTKPPFQFFDPEMVAARMASYTDRQLSRGAAVFWNILFDLAFQSVPQGQITMTLSHLSRHTGSHVGSLVKWKRELIERGFIWCVPCGTSCTYHLSCFETSNNKKSRLTKPA